MVRTVKPLFRLPRGSALRSLRELVEFLKLACLYWGSGTAYYRGNLRSVEYVEAVLVPPF